MKTIKEEIRKIAEIDTPVDGVSVRKLSKGVVREATEKSKYRSPGDRYTYSVTSYVVFDDEGRTVEIETGWPHSRGLNVWLGLLARSGGSIPLAEQEDLVPVKIAALGKPEVAGYLFAVHNLNRAEIGDILGVAPETVNQYLSDISRGRRKKS